MNWIEAVILGLVQGLTEFFPVSSSAHVKIVKTLFGLNSKEETALFDLYCHLGTVLVLILYFRRDIWTLLSTQKKTLGIYFLALLPLIPAYFLLKPVRDFASQPHMLGYCLFITAAILFIGDRQKAKASLNQKLFKPSLRDGLIIGASQALALIPGISRSGCTISTARVLGWSSEHAVRFSFLLSIPAILGGLLLESLKVWRMENLPSVHLDLCLIGTLSSFGAGLFTISFAIRYLSQGHLKPFAIYCLGLGFLSLTR